MADAAEAASAPATEATGSGLDRGSIHCWSGPRCCSTSLMYSFAQRDDCTVLDEPLYASYLAVTGHARPYRTQVMAAQNCDGSAVVAQLLLGPRPKPLLYSKHIGKQKAGITNAVFRAAQHMILVREPYGVLQSFSAVLEPTQQEIGYTALLEILSELRVAGQRPIVVLSDELVRQPEGVLRAVCHALGIAFQPAMLTWPAGPKPYDGVWAPYWYANTHKGTGFSYDVREARKPLAPHLKPLMAESYAIYDVLSRHAIRPVMPRGAAVPRPLPPPPIDAADGVDADVGAGDTGEGPAPDHGGPAGHGHGHGEGEAEKSGTHVYVQDTRNDDVLIGIRDGVTGRFELAWRPYARVSVLDSGYMLGDGVWEGIRLHKGVLYLAEAHLERLWEGAKALDMELGLSRGQMQQLLYDTVDANGMADASGVHIRLMVTRGLKPTPYQNPNITIGKPTIVVIPEYKEAAPGPRERGIRLFTVHVRRGNPDVQDPGLNSHSKLNCIAACIQANHAGVDEALMLDPQGFVATCNSTNFFIVRKGEVIAPSPRHQLRGITRATVLQLCRSHGIPASEQDFYLTQVYSADEAFVTGTFAGCIPVVEVDGRRIGAGRRGPVVQHLQQLHMASVEAYAACGRRSMEEE